LANNTPTVTVKVTATYINSYKSNSFDITSQKLT
jgi:hypothetical protein